MSDSPPNRPAIEVPEGVVDRVGRRLRPGSTVSVPDGRLGEVVGYRGFAGVEVLTTDDDLGAWPPDQLIRTEPGTPVDSVTLGWYVVDDDPTSVSVAFPVGGQDIQPGRDLGPFPPPNDFPVDRAMSRKVSARAWGEACLAAIDGLHPTNAAGLVASHLDAPILRRVLVEASLPERVRRLTLIVTDQDPPHPGDTRAFGDLLRLWLIGTASRRARQVDEVIEPLVLTEAPHLLEAVRFAVAGDLPRLLGDASRLVVVQTGGTPAMAVGTLLAAAMLLERPLRHVQVPENQPLVEADFPPLRQVPFSADH